MIRRAVSIFVKDGQKESNILERLVNCGSFCFMEMSVGDETDSSCQTRIDTRYLVTAALNQSINQSINDSMGWLDGGMSPR